MAMFPFSVFFFAISCSLAFLLVAIFSVIEDIEEFEPQYECDSLEEFCLKGDMTIRMAGREQDEANS